MSGPPPTPTSLKLLRGNPGKRALNKQEPTPDSLEKGPPAWLDARAKSLWRELEPMLTRTRVLTEADRRSLELLCDAYSEYRAAREFCRKNGTSYEAETDRGRSVTRVRAEVGIYQDAWKRVRAMLQEFGMTPAARSKVKVVQGATEDSYEQHRAARK